MKVRSSRVIERVRRGRRHIKDLGPGIITGGAGDDPAGIVTYTTVGASTGFSLLWLMLLSTPMMIALQDMAARLAVITGKSLPEIVQTFHSRRLSLFMVMVLAMANTITIGADLHGLSSVLEMITGIESVYLMVPVTAIIAYLVVFRTYRTLKRFFMGLTFVLLAYLVAAVTVGPDLKEIARSTFIPHMEGSPAFLLAALGLLGTTVSPYLLFWQAAEEREEHKTVAQAREVAWDTAIGMVYSNLIAFSIIIVAAVVLHGRGLPLESVRDAAMALEPLGTERAFLLFSIGILASGFLAIPVLAGSTAYAISDAFGWREGLDHKVSDAKGFYAVFFGALIIGDTIYLSPLSAVEALYYSQILDGMLLPLLVLILLFLNNDERIVGESRNSRFNNIFGSLTLLFSMAFTLVTLLQMFGGQ